MNREEVIKLVEDTVSLVQRFKGGQDFPVLEVRFDVTKPSICAYAYDNEPIVDFNLSYMEKMGGDFRDVVLHEIAHHMQAYFYPDAKQGHGPEWRICCNTIGCTGNTKIDHDSFDFPESRVNKVVRHRHDCGCRKHYLTKKNAEKIEAGYKYRCRHCKVRLSNLVDLEIVPSNMKFELF